VAGIVRYLENIRLNRVIRWLKRAHTNCLFTQNKIYFKYINAQGPYILTATYRATAVCEKVLRGEIPCGTIAAQHLILTGQIGVLSVVKYPCRTPYRQELLPSMGNQVSSANESLDLWKRDVTPDRSPAQHGRGGTVGGSGNCATDTEVSKQSDVGRSATIW